jgi:hypothetical protein
MADVLAFLRGGSPAPRANPLRNAMAAVDEAGTGPITPHYGLAQARVPAPPRVDRPPVIEGDDDAQGYLRTVGWLRHVITAHDMSIERIRSEHAAALAALQEEHATILTRAIEKRDRYANDLRDAIDHLRRLANAVGLDLTEAPAVTPDDAP